MPESLTDQKSALRATARAMLQALTSEQKQSAAESICKRLMALSYWKGAQSVLLFASRPDEPDIWGLAHIALAQQKEVYLPRFVPDTGRYEAALIANPAEDVVPGKFGILEPAPLCSVADWKRLDLVLVPGLAFDWHGHRLGRGKGYYDRLLASVSGKTCGVAFDPQLISALPVEPHDVRLNCILTPSHWLEV
jgi:5-formyltetrahydrofolate cyclo-ligase